MQFVTKFCSRLKYYNITHNMPDLIFKSVCLLLGNAQLIFLCNPSKLSDNACLMKKLKSTVTKKVFVCFYNLGKDTF